MKIRDLISCRWHWTVGRAAATFWGSTCALDYPKAYRWCLYAALCRAYPKGQYPISHDEIYHKLLDAIHTLPGYGWCSVVEFNDNCSWREMKAVLKAADV